MLQTKNQRMLTRNMQHPSMMIEEFSGKYNKIFLQARVRFTTPPHSHCAGRTLQQVPNLLPAETFTLSRRASQKTSACRKARRLSLYSKL
jgi:hypothetical protein